MKLPTGTANSDFLSAAEELKFCLGVVGNRLYSCIQCT